jgi:hypothetical protein
MVVKPYVEYSTTSGMVRIFDRNLDSKELVWHRDKKARTVRVLNKADWKIQMDNEVPLDMKHNFTIFIPKETYHRVIKGTTDLVVDINETT